MSVLTTRIWPPFIIITSKIPISYNTLSLLHISRLDKTFLKQNLQAVSVTSDHKIEFTLENLPLHSQSNDICCKFTGKGRAGGVVGTQIYKYASMLKYTNI